MTILATVHAEVSMQTKEAIREHFKAWRKTLALDVQLAAANTLCVRFLELLALDKNQDVSSHRIGFYEAILGEVPTRSLLETCLQRGIRCFLPVFPEETHHKILAYVEVFHDSELMPGTFGTKVPKSGLALPAASLTHMLVPALAVTAEGDRLGFGAGYFDATIHEARKQANPPLCWGVVYRSQCVKELPQSPWDERLDGVILV